MHPLNARSIAEGRSESPPLPREFFWIEFTARVNAAMGTHYAIAELQIMPGDEIEKIALWLETRAGAIA